MMHVGKPALFLGALVLGFTTLSAPSGSVAQEAEVQWRGVALQRLDLHWPERWEWFRDQLAEKTDGRFQLELVTFPVVGLTGSALIGLLNPGLLDAGAVVTGYVSGEVPLFEGVQLPGVYVDYEQARLGYAAWLDNVVEPRQEAVGGKVLTSFAFASQFLWTNFPINDLSDLQDKKIRVFAKAQADYLATFGAEPVNIPLADVYTALQLGTVDGAVTGPEFAAGAKLWEVISHVTDLRMGVGAGFMVVSEQSWQALSEADQALIDELVPELRRRAWDIGRRNTEDNLKVVVDNGIVATIPFKPEWDEPLQQATLDAVLTGWAERAGPDGKPSFNQYLAPIVGFSME
jgi:TRAP-type C4-dicarboxylate transport system substrate-binding protein